MRTIYFIIYIVLIIQFFWSCSPPAYIPNIVNTPLLSSKGEFQATIGTGTSGYDPQFAYAVTNDLGIMVNASYANRTDTTEFNKHTFAELGVGYLLPFGNGGHFELFGGAGMGKIDAKNWDNSLIYYQNYSRTKADLTRIFIQPSVGIVSKAFDGAFTPRIVFLNVNHSINNNTFDSTLNTHNFDPFIEPTVTAKVGWKYVKMFFQIGFSIPVTRFKNYTNQRLMFSFGLTGKIPGKRKSDSNNTFKEGGETD